MGSNPIPRIIVINMEVNAERSDVKSWLAVLEQAQHSDKRAKLWKRLYKLASKPTRQRIEVDLYKIDRHTSENDNVIVPGKVLSAGQLGHAVSISAISFSAKALEAIEGSKGKVVPLEEMMKREKINVII